MNPELRRNLWLEATPARLVLLPAILVGIFFLAFVSDDHSLRSGTATAAIACLAILTWGWGAHLASESVLAELRGHTWDWQRMSGLGAWTLTWGKLAGATAPAWYGGAFCLVAFALAEPVGWPAKGWLAALFVLAAVLGQAATLFAALHAASRGRVAARAQSSVYLVAGAILAVQVGAGVATTSRIDWYGLTPTPLVFATLSVAAFAALAVAGAWARVRQELRFRTLPVVWPAFLAFVMLWAAGFAGGDDGWDGARPLVAFLVAVAAAWTTALLERKDPVALRRLARAAREGRWRALAEELPPWILALPFVVGAWGVLALRPRLWTRVDGDARVFAAAVALFLARDLAIVVSLNLGARTRRADLLALVLFAVAYLLVPLVLSAGGARRPAALFFPDPEHALTSVVGALVQGAIAARLLVVRWRASERAVAVGGA